MAIAYKAIMGPGNSFMCILRSFSSQTENPMSFVPLFGNIVYLATSSKHFVVRNSSVYSSPLAKEKWVMESLKRRKNMFMMERN